MRRYRSGWLTWGLGWGIGIFGVAGIARAEPDEVPPLKGHVKVEAPEPQAALEEAPPKAPANPSLHAEVQQKAADPTEFSLQAPLHYVNLGRAGWAAFFRGGQNIVLKPAKARTLLLEGVFNPNFGAGPEDIPYCYIRWEVRSRKGAEAVKVFKPILVNASNIVGLFPGLFSPGGGAMRSLEMVLTSPQAGGALTCVKAQDRSEAFTEDEVRAIVGGVARVGNFGGGRERVYYPGRTK